MSYQKLTKKRWVVAQEAERKQHTMSFAEGFVHYAESYMNYFRFVGLGKDLGHLKIIEIGPADFPALNYCHSGAAHFIIEPLPSEHLKKICEDKGLQLITDPWESVSEETLHIIRDTGANAVTEVWLFNVMQHVADPDAFIEKCKSIADRIRFFEPINEPVTEYHPHTYALSDYQTWFPDSVQLYAGGSVKGFHEADCAYGVWHK